MADKRAYCLGVDARATRGPAGATVKRCACEVAQYMLFGRANAPAKTTEASVYAFNCKESDNDLHTDDNELGLNVVKLLRMEKTGAPGIIKTVSSEEWPMHDDDCAGIVDCVGAMVAEAQKRIGTKKVNKRVVLITDDSSCALWTTDEDAARAKDDFKGMVERLVSQVSFGLCVVIVETDQEKTPEALEGAKLLKKACGVATKKGPVSGFFVKGSADDIALLTQEACGRLEACKVRIQKPMELKLAPGLTCYVTSQPLAEESKQLALKQQTREAGNTIATTREYVRTDKDDADPFDADELVKAYYYGGEYVQCPPDVLKHANEDDDEYGAVVLGCYDEALGSPWSCGDAGGASGNRAQLLRATGERNKVLLAAFARSLRDQKQVAVISFKLTKKSANWRLACLQPALEASALVLTPLPYQDDVKPTPRIRQADIPEDLQSAVDRWCDAHTLSTKDVSKIRRCDDPVVLNLQDLACVRAVEGDDEAFQARKKARFERLKAPVADEADEHWRHTLKAWREKSEKSSREQPGPTQPSLNQADDIEMNVEEVPAPPVQRAEVTLRKRHALQDFDAHWAVADDDARRSVLREDLRAVILALARDAEVSDAYVREGLGCLNRLRAVCAGRHEAEFDAFLLGAIAESKVDNPDWEDALEGQEPFAGGAAPAEAPFADDGPDTQSHKGDDDDGDDFD
mmetsp:Transcript_22030/g.61965  ORF Transcript_22030/g.61965 Transcript_22030/m.61965 type:complete len:689 (-) Transcript_22030:27-2093(-)